MKKLIKLMALFMVLIVMLSACGIEEFTNLQNPTAGDTPGAIEDANFEVHYIDVGQADSILIKCDGKTMLIDAGNREDSDLIYAYLKAQDVAYLDYLVITHGHEDHVGGAAGALNAVKVGVAYCSVTSYKSKVFGNFLKYLNDQGKEITVPKHGDTFMLGSAKCEIVGPISESEEPNNTSIVMKVTYNNVSYLFTGDAEIDEENEIIEAGYDISCDVLKVGHHGSNTSTGYRFLREAAPKYAVISCEKGNSYGHPHEEPLSRLRDADVHVYRTDMQGTIISYVDKNGNIGFVTGKNFNADTLEGAGAGGNHAGNNGYGNNNSGAESSQGAQEYVLNTNSKKFHKPSGQTIENISEKNREERKCHRQNLIDEGYSPCGICKP